MENLQSYLLRPGDQLVEAIFTTGLTKHFAVNLGRLSDGQEWIAENHHLTGGVKLITVRDYAAAGRSLVRIDRFSGTGQERKQVILRALKLAGKSYDLVQYNCEHFATQVTTGLAESKQVRNVIGGLVLLLFIGLWRSE
jgi:hypothetical protein